MPKDPVCGMEVSDRDEHLRSEREGNAYYFCSPGCKSEFDRNPEKYATGVNPQGVGPQGQQTERNWNRPGGEAGGSGKRPSQETAHGRESQKPRKKYGT